MSCSLNGRHGTWKFPYMLQTQAISFAPSGTHSGAPRHVCKGRIWMPIWTGWVELPMADIACIVLNYLFQILLVNEQNSNRKCRIPLMKCWPFDKMIGYIVCLSWYWCVFTALNNQDWSFTRAKKCNAVNQRMMSIYFAEHLMMTRFMQHN